MTDQESLLKAITQQPEDDVLRLAYCDWLQENDREDLATCIKSGLDSNHTITFDNSGHHRTDSRGWSLRDVWMRESAQWWQFDQILLNEMIPPPSPTHRCEVRLHRGFPADLTVPIQWWLTHGDEIVKKVPALIVRPYMVGLDCTFLKAGEVVGNRSLNWHLAARRRKATFPLHKIPETLVVMKQLCRLEWPQVLDFADPLIELE